MTQPVAKFQSEIDLEVKYLTCVNALLLILADGSYKDIASQFAYEALDKVGELPDHLRNGGREVQKQGQNPSGDSEGKISPVVEERTFIRTTVDGVERNEEVRADDSCHQSPPAPITTGA